MKLTRSDVSAVLELAAATTNENRPKPVAHGNGRFEGNTIIIIAAATNRPDVLDSALCDQDALTGK